MAEGCLAVVKVKLASCLAPARLLIRLRCWRWRKARPLPAARLANSPLLASAGQRRETDLKLVEMRSARPWTVPSRTKWMCAC